MATEQEYDEIVAPMLAAVAYKCRDLGMSLVARVEWEPGESDITQIGDLKSAGQMLAQYAAHSHGNFDALCFRLLKEVDVSQSLFLAPHANGAREAK